MIWKLENIPMFSMKLVDSINDDKQVRHRSTVWGPRWCNSLEQNSKKRLSYSKSSVRWCNTLEEVRKWSCNRMVSQMCSSLGPNSTCSANNNMPNQCKMYRKRIKGKWRLTWASWWWWCKQVANSKQEPMSSTCNTKRVKNYPDFTGSSGWKSHYSGVSVV